MFELLFSNLRAGGVVMIPIVLLSVIALAIAVFKALELRRSRVIPSEAVEFLNDKLESGSVTTREIRMLRETSPFGELGALVLLNAGRGREELKEMVHEEGRRVIHGLNRYLNALGTIASVTPLLGLLGTVLGMIDVFAVINSQGVGSANALAGGISQALVTTAAGLIIGIPALMAYHFFKGRVVELAVSMERTIAGILDMVYADR
ncbi:MotA/TolQ/ExbB proton channel family protein [Gammaproteobacteria bacterium]|nr:MotA/TolQ/ExbB proton channel family protein [Gammaproteobacteria bacterium]